MSAAMRWPFSKKVVGPTICRECYADLAPRVDRCPCGWIVPNSALPEPVLEDPSTWVYWKRRGISRAACDFCHSPWLMEWIDQPGGGRRYVCVAHGEPRSWLSDVPVAERLSEQGMAHAAGAPGVRVWKGP